MKRPEPQQTLGLRLVGKKGLDAYEYTGIPAYLMDFGFGGFLGYGKGVPVGLVNEELKRRKMDDV